MIDTNTIAAVTQTAPKVQGLFTAWNAVALGAGAFLTGIYNHIVAAGGVKNIARNLWDGGASVPASRANQTPPQPNGDTK
jgi:hypothetical protein